MLCSLERRLVSIANREPMVSFTFDDFPRTAYSIGGAILERFGARGTYYAACGLMNSSNELGDQFRPRDLDSLLGKGHELASHTYGHTSARAVSCEAFCKEVEKGRRAVEEIVGTESGNFAYPFGHVTLRTKRALDSKLSTARSIFGGFNGGFDGPEADLNLLRANSLYGGLEAATAAEQLIAENVRRKSWLIFYTHDVRENPSPYGCTPALLEASISCTARSGCRILTVKEALAEAGFQNGNCKDHARECVTA
jgi:peptidoglycan/xylan/chitin deacetylase (PgdA/CDA1 family)